MRKNQKKERRQIFKEAHEAKIFTAGVRSLPSTNTSSASERVYYLRGVGACDRKFCFALPRRRADT
jgi:hypothetical protein